MLCSIISAIYLITVSRKRVKKLDQTVFAWMGILYSILWGFCYTYFLSYIIIFLIIVSWILICIYIIGGKFDILPHSIKNLRSLYFYYRKDTCEEVETILKNSSVKITMREYICVIHDIKNKNLLEKLDEIIRKQSKFNISEYIYIGLLGVLIIACFYYIVDVRNIFFTRL